MDQEASRLDLHCPAKTIKISNLDGKFNSTAVKQAARRKNREYSKHGNSARYKLLKKEVKNRIKEETTKFIKKQTDNATSNNSSWMKHVKMLTARPGDNLEVSFQLPKHLQMNMSALDSSNKICEAA